MDTPPSYLETDDGHRIAYRHVAGTEPGILFCSGFHSNMQGDKALALEAWCRETGRQFTRFDYFGHGESSGDAAAGRIGRWADDTRRVLDKVCRGPQVLVGSSMGGWMMLLTALARTDRVVGLVGIASAPDFSRAMKAVLEDSGAWALIERDGFYDMPSHYPGESTYRIEQGFVEEAEQHCLLDSPVDLNVPVRLLHGQADADVPYQRSMLLAEALTCEDVEITLVKDGDHRLSRPGDLALLQRVLEALLSGLSTH